MQLGTTAESMRSKQLDQPAEEKKGYKGIHDPLERKGRRGESEIDGYNACDECAYPHDS
jgi:hypothetical protein